MIWPSEESSAPRLRASPTKAVDAVSFAGAIPKRNSRSSQISRMITAAVQRKNHPLESIECTESVQTKVCERGECDQDAAVECDDRWEALNIAEGAA